MIQITYRTEIVRALQELGGAASLKEICQNIEQKNILPNIHTNGNWTRNISAEIQRHCSATKSYSGAANVFYSVFGLGEGIWGLNSYLQNEESDKEQIKSNMIFRQIDKIKNDTSIPETEKIAIIEARRGQGLFRKELLKRYSSCVITKITDTKLLIASHIKPWRSANNIERLSTENGIILSPTYDKLFDIGLISFKYNGKVIISKCLNDYNKGKLNIDLNFSYLQSISDEMKQNLEYHRDVIFEKIS